MSSTRYIELDSTYRDRVQYPNPAQFTAEISQSGQKARLQALDPVSDATPQIIFSPNDFSGAVPLTTLVGAVDALSTATIGATSDSKTFIGIFATAQVAQKGENYYKGAIIVNTTLSAQRRIEEIRYLNTAGGFDHFVITVDRSFPDTFAAADVLNILNPTDLNDTSNPLVFVPSSENITNFYHGDLLYNQTTSDFRVIKYYDPTTHIVEVDTSTAGAVVGWALTDTYTIRKAAPCETGTLQNGTITTATLDATTASAIDNEYKNSYIRMISGAAINDIRRITSYVGSTRVATVSPPFSAVVNPLENYEILCFTTDNVNPFTYTGSLTSQQQAVCYEVELINLILPNRTLVSGRGGRIAFYPYIYVELQQISAPSASTKGVIYSNNPNAYRMLFRAAVDDTPTPLVSPFIKIDGDGTVQTVKFKPNDAFRFSVYQAGGELFQLRSLNTDSISGEATIDTTAPRRPDPLVQISAMFSFKRVQ